MDHASGVGLALVSALGFGAVAVFARLGMRHVRPTTATVASLIISALVTLVVALSVDAGEIASLSAVAFGLILLNAAMSYLVGRLFNFTGVRLVGASRASIIIGTSPLFSAGLAVWLLGEKLSAPILAGTVLIIIGVGVILSGRREVVDDGGTPPGKTVKPRGTGA